MDELKNKTEVNIEHKPFEPEMVTSTNVKDLTGLIKTVSVVPTRTPRSFFEQVVLYVNGTTARLYVYDTVGNTWVKLTNTTVQESNGGVVLEGDVIIGDGSGVTLSRTGQTIVISAP